MRMTSQSRGRVAGRRLLALYPHRWRARYEPEMLALLADRPPTWRDRIDLVRGALDAHLHPERVSRLPGRAALLAGAAWTVVALAVLAEPVPPDWPGLWAWTLAPALLAVSAGMVATVGFALRLGDAPGRSGRAATAAVIATNGIWAVALIVAIVGGPYGAVTAAAGSLAAAAVVGLGSVLTRAGHHPIGAMLAVAGGALLLPPPASWVIAAIAWTAIGLHEAAHGTRAHRAWPVA
jgi:hypothetical protein